MFDLVEQPGSPDDADRVEPRPRPFRPRLRAGQAPRPRGPRPERPEDQSHLDPSALVEQVWSRTAEWGPTLIVLGVWVAMVLFLFEYFFGSESRTGFPGASSWVERWRPYSATRS